MKKIILLFLIILVIFLIKYAVVIINCNTTYNATHEELTKDTGRFNTNSKIKYSYLSQRLKDYIDKEEFEIIKTWENAYDIFQRIPKQDLNPEKINKYSFKYIISYSQEESRICVSYNVRFINTFFGMKIDHIKIQMSTVQQ